MQGVAPTVWRTISVARMTQAVLRTQKCEHKRRLRLLQQQVAGGASTAFRWSFGVELQGGVSWTRYLSWLLTAPQHAAKIAHKWYLEPGTGELPIHQLHQLCLVYFFHIHKFEIINTIDDAVNKMNKTHDCE